jgi:hypothetical protein
VKTKTTIMLAEELLIAAKRRAARDPLLGEPGVDMILRASGLDGL